MASSVPPDDIYDVAMARARAASSALGRVAADLACAHGESDDGRRRVTAGECRLVTAGERRLVTAEELLHRLNEDLCQ